MFGGPWRLDAGRMFNNTFAQSTSTTSHTAFDRGCPQCGRSLLISCFDTTFAFAGGDERQLLGLPGGMCQPCQQLYLEPQLIDRLVLAAARCTFAIESDQFLLQEAWVAADAA